MRVSLTKGLLGIIFLLACLPVWAQTDAEKKGIVTHADGQVKKQPPAAQNWVDAPVNTDVLSGDKMRTFRQSRAELNLADLDIIRMAPRTIIRIKKLYEETKDKVVETDIDLDQGEIWASVHEVESNTKFDVSAPVAAAAITGTQFRMRVDPDSTTQLKVYHGEVHITNAPEKTDLRPKSLQPREVPGPREIPGPREVTLEEWMYIVKAMQQITIDPKGEITSITGFKIDDPDEKSDWVNWNKQRDIQRIQELRRN